MNTTFGYEKATPLVGHRGPKVVFKMRGVRQGIIAPPK